MTIKITVPENQPNPELKPRITVIGVGGGGGNAVNNMIESKLEGVDFVVANTDAQALSLSKTDRRIQLGTGTTQGLGAGARPEVGRAAAEESLSDIQDAINGSHMVFIAAGMGGGTGTGAAPVIARTAREQGILTVGVVTKPFGFEGGNRMRLAQQGLEELSEYVDTLIIIPNQNLFRVANEKTTFTDAFTMADKVLYSGVRGITDLMVMPGLINLDFADVRTVMGEMGKAMMGTGEAEGERRALDAAEAAISNPLLDDTTIKGARGVLISITGGNDMTLFEVDEAANHIRDQVDPEANINFGATFDESLDGRLRVSVVATGIDSVADRQSPGETQRRLDVRSTPRPLEAKAESRHGAPVIGPRAPQPAIPAKPAAAELAAKAPQAPSLEPKVEARPEPSLAPAAESRVAVSSVDAAEPKAEAQLEDKLEAQADVRPEPKPEPQVTLSEIGDDEPEAKPAEKAHEPREPFIPPRPQETESDLDMAHADPIGTTDLMNGAKPSEKPKKSGIGKGLFNLVTGTQKAKAQEAETGSEALGAARSEKAPAPQTQLKTESQLGGLDPEQRLQQSKSEDDLLDIPAFLRRQAN